MLFLLQEHWFDRLNFASGQMDDTKFKRIQADICRFIMREVVYPRGKFFNPEGELAQYPDLCDYTTLGLSRPQSFQSCA